MRRAGRIGCGLLIAGLMLLAAIAVAEDGAARNQVVKDAAAASTTKAATPTEREAGATIKAGPARPAKAVTHAVIKAGPTTPAKTTSRSKADAPSTGKSTTTAPPPAPADGRTATPRTLDEISIQGEIPVPQVLFITARDQRRFLDFHHRRYLKTSQRVGETTVFPSWISVANGVEPPVQGPPR